MTTIEDIRKNYLGDELYRECNQGGINDYKLDMRAKELDISKETLINQCKLKASTLEELFDKFTYTVKKGTKITRVEKVYTEYKGEKRMYKWYTLYREEPPKNFWVELKCKEECVYTEYVIPYDMKFLRFPYISAEMELDTENESNYKDFWRELIILLTNIVDNTYTEKEYKFRLNQSIIEFITAFEHEPYQELHSDGVDYTMAEFICQFGFKGWVRFVKRNKTHPSDEILVCNSKDLIEVRSIRGKTNDIISQLN